MQPSHKFALRHKRAILFALFACLSACKPEVGNRSAIVLLLDYSKSFAPYTKADEAALRETNRFISKIIRNSAMPQPVKILWTAFGDDGLRPLEPCGPPRVIDIIISGRKSTTEGIDHFDKLEAWLSVCLSAVRATSQITQKFTDISGALVFASDAVEDVSDERLIIVFSDLLEDLPSDRQMPKFNLKGAKVLLIWRPGMDDQQQPLVVQQRVESWRKKLETSGASRVCSKAAQGLTEGELSACLWK
jgi:hypothetical protein